MRKNNLHHTFFRGIIPLLPKCAPAIQLLFLLLLVPAMMMAQSKKSLEDKRKKLTREIEITNKLLDKTKQNKSAAYDHYLTLQSQISRRESLIQTIDNEITESEEGIGRNAAVINALSVDIDNMKSEYGRLIRAAYRRKVLSNPLVFLLSADNLNQAFRRLLFLRKYNQFRKSQADAIRFTQEILSRKVNALAQRKIEKEQLLLEMSGQRSVLSNELSDKNKLLKSLNRDEAKLMEDLKAKQEARINLDNSIERVIAAEMKKNEVKVAEQKKAAEKKKATEQKAAEKKLPEITASAPTNTPKVKTNTSPPKTVIAPAETTETLPAESEEDIMSNSFKNNRGRLPWPVEGGFIARSFGRQKHPTLKNIEITNNGIDIRTSEDAPVRAIFEGTVAGIQFIPGHDYTVILKHGNYYTVYANLSQTPLSRGQVVAAGGSIGSVSTNAISGAAELHFELWRNKERMNPAQWIK